ncbi:MAG: cache domain-containing protein [Pseudomonadota bacterium]
MRTQKRRKKGRSVVSVILLAMFFLTLLSTGVFSWLWIRSEISLYRENSLAMETEFMDVQKARIKTEVDRIIDYAVYKKSQIEDRLKQDISARTLEAVHIVSSIYGQCKAHMDDKDTRDLIRETLRSIRFYDGRGYFFIIDMQGDVILNAESPDLEGKSAIDLRDPENRPFIMEMITLAKNQGEGFLKYVWKLPEAGSRKATKISFVKHIPGVDWIIGTGEYLEFVEAAIQEEVLARLERISFENDGYVFAGTWDGIALSARPVKGKNMFNLTDLNGVKIVQELIQAAKQGGGFVEYVIPEFNGVKSAPKISYARSIDDWQWYIGCGVYVGDITAILDQKRQTMNKRIADHFLEITLLLSGITAIILGLALYLSKQIGANFKSFSAFFTGATTRFEPIEVDNLSLIEFRDLAVSANTMIHERNRMDTELNESKAWLENILNTVQSGILVVEVSTHVIKDINPAACLIIGVPREQILNQSCLGTLCSGRNGICPIGNGQEGMTNQECTLHRSDNTEVPILKTVIRKHMGDTEYFIESIIDITEKKRLEDQVIQAQKLEAIGTLAGGIAHDFNNLLTPIIGYTEMLSHDLSGHPSHEEKLEKILTAAIRARELIKQILTLSRKSESDFKTFFPQPVIKETLKLLRATIPTTIRINQYISDNCGHVLGNPIQIQQVLMNLCTNAFHAIDDAPGIIDIRLDLAENDITKDLNRQTGSSHGQYLVLTVKDTGCGMDAALASRIFEPYFTTKKQGKGTGLGLSIVDGIVKTHGGTIRVESTPGAGTVFRVYLPVIPESHVAGAAELDHLPPGAGQSILLVDDEPGVGETTRDSLQRLGYKVFLCGSSLEALKRFCRTPMSFDLVLTDMTMPELTGALLAKELLGIRPDIPVVIYTGFVDSIDSETLIQTGVRALMHKPLTLRDLAVTLSSILHPPPSHGLQTESQLSGLFKLNQQTPYS